MIRIDEFLSYLEWTLLRWVQKLVRDFGLFRSPRSSNVLVSERQGLITRSSLVLLARRRQEASGGQRYGGCSAVVSESFPNHFN